jgi:glucosyl-3-phosphoglycerate phosphatase
MHFNRTLLLNSYYCLRHGHSLPMSKGLIVSSLENGIKIENGLTDLGIEQASMAGKLAKLQFKPHEIILVCSPFSRAIQTAKSFASELGIDHEKVIIDHRARERDFGTKEYQLKTNYQLFWEADILDPDSTIFGSESINQVQSRLLNLIWSLEALHQSKHIIIVSHGDPIMILETKFKGMDVKLHHSALPYIRNAELRAL